MTEAIVQSLCLFRERPGKRSWSFLAGKITLSKRYDSIQTVCMDFLQKLREVRS
jgi:hypothetical protein